MTSLRLAVSALALAISSPAVSAADFGFNDNGNPFAGPYVGLFGGYQGAKIVGNFHGYVSNGYPEINYQSEYDNSLADGWKYGGYAGYNVAVDSFIFGLELGGGGQDVSKTMLEEYNPGTSDYAYTKAESQLEWFVEAKLKAGYTLDNNMVYATGGVAINREKFKSVYEYPRYPNYYAEAEGTFDSISPILGVGYERIFDSGMTLRAEANYTLSASENKLGDAAGTLSPLYDYTKLDGIVDIRVGVGFNF